MFEHFFKKYKNMYTFLKKPCKQPRCDCGWSNLNEFVPARRFPASSRAPWWAERSRGNQAEEMRDKTILATPTVRDRRTSSLPPGWERLQEKRTFILLQWVKHTDKTLHLHWQWRFTFYILYTNNMIKTSTARQFYSWSYRKTLEL